MELKIQIYINNNFSSVATERLLSFNIEDNSGLQLDNMLLEINNYDDGIAIPKTNSIIELAIGSGEHIYKMGRFIAQNISSTDSIITISCISQDLNFGRIKHNRVFKDKSLEDILKTLANDLDLGLYNNVNAQVGYYLQENKTSLEVLAELSEIFFAVANIKDNNLVFVSKENPKEVSINDADILNIAIKDNSKKYYNGVMLNS
ncbi:MAG: hypothetical protein LBQ34_03925 [Alphaproteobacteria bacterium]|jgi:phage protein D|nr:hypothetical protein [Alphaproteobacteria bacterium]